MQFKLTVILDTWSPTSSSKKLGEFGGEGSASDESFLFRTGVGFAKTVAGGL